MADATPTMRTYDWAALVKRFENTNSKPIEKPVAYEFSTGRKFVQEEFSGNYTP